VTRAEPLGVEARISIDVLRSARVRREEYVGPWFPEPLLTDPYEDPEVNRVVFADVTRATRRRTRRRTTARQ
jgi:hypothetical protein